jgi:hypothetical protein
MEGRAALTLSWKRTLGTAGIIFAVALKDSFILERADLWGWRELTWLVQYWAEIQLLALIGSSSSLHSEACNALGSSDGVIHSSIS